MGNGSSGTCSFSLTVLTGAVVVLGLMAIPALAQRTVQRDPAEPAQGQPNPQPKPLARPAGGVPRQAVDEKSMRALIGKLVACGTRLTLSSWTDKASAASRTPPASRSAPASIFHPPPAWERLPPAAPTASAEVCPAPALPDCGACFSAPQLELPRGQLGEKQRLSRPKRVCGA